MIRTLGAWGRCVGAAVFALGCSGSTKDGDDAEDSEAIAAFVGRWVATDGSTSDSCSGDFEGAELTMELRRGTNSDLEYVEFRSSYSSEIACVQSFDVQDRVAKLRGAQECIYEFPSFEDETGAATTSTNRVLFTEDRIDLYDDTLRERGKSQHEKAGGRTCVVAFEILFERE